GGSVLHGGGGCRRRGDPVRGCRRRSGPTGGPRDGGRDNRAGPAHDPRCRRVGGTGERGDRLARHVEEEKRICGDGGRYGGRGRFEPGTRIDCGRRNDGALGTSRGRLAIGGGRQHHECQERGDAACDDDRRHHRGQDAASL
ncbi:MAG: hypothetical protein AVDCRST_MAG73-4260, partial [uncultured Thermomicrobiales bacterium]